MNATSSAEAREKTSLKHQNLGLSWQDSPPVQRLLDVIADIIASEYVQIAKQSPETFLSGGANK